jgi:hypothetical protein
VADGDRRRPARFIGKVEWRDTGAQGRTEREKATAEMMDT